MAMTAYAHLPEPSTRLLIALYAACGLYCDDVFERDVEAIRDFNASFVKGLTHGDPVLDCYAQVIRELAEHFGPIAGNIVITASLASQTALLLEHETEGMEVCAKIVPLDEPISDYGRRLAC